MNNFFKKTSNLIFSKQSGIFSSAILISFFIVLTSFFGFLRYRILATYFYKDQLDIFFASFKIPDLIYEILITGALTTTFIPLYLKYQGSEENLNKNISSIINFIFIFLIIFILLSYFFIDKIITILTPGYDLIKTEKIVSYSKILLLGQLPFFIFGSILTGLGQANKIFFLSGLAPVIYNLSIILLTIFFHDLYSLNAAIYGVIIGAFLFFLVQLPVLRFVKFKYQLIFKKTQGLIDFIRLVIPRTLTIVISQIDATIDLILASLLGGGAYSIFYLAQHLQFLPVSIIGVSFGQASLPYLTELFHEKKIDQLKNIIIQSVLNILFLTIPIGVFFIFARTPLVRLFFGGEKFDWQATVSTAITLSYFSIGLPFHSIYYFLIRCFYAILDSKTPFFIGLSSIFINIFFSVIFVFLLKMPIWSLAISFSISIIVNNLLLFIFLNKKLFGFEINKIILKVFKILMISLISGFISYFLMRFLDGFIFNTIFTFNLFLLLVVVSGFYLVLYLFLSWLMNIEQVYIISKLLIKAKEYQKKIIELFTNYE